MSRSDAAPPQLSSSVRRPTRLIVGSTRLHMSMSRSVVVLWARSPHSLACVRAAGSDICRHVGVGRHYMAALSPLGILLVAGLAGALFAPCHPLAAQASDSTGMPPLDQLALEAGRASRRHPIRTVARTILCEPTHPLVDSAALAACAALDPARAAAITAAFARGLEVPLADTTSDDSTLALCPADIDRVAEPRVLAARLLAPIAGVNEGRWEGRLTVEIRCRASGAGSSAGVRTMGKEYLYQWNGREWRLYQFAWLRGDR